MSVSIATDIYNQASTSGASKIEAGSFRDRNARVFYYNGRIFRTLSNASLTDYKSLEATIFFKKALSESIVVKTELVSGSRLPSELMDGAWQGLLEHEVIPFISYPYEWSFGMLKDAALLHLDLFLQALEEQFVIKDSSSFNIQWRGYQPVFIDIPSFERYREGDLWAGYKQFCQMFLFPLMLQSYKKIPFQSWLRGNIDGFEIEDFYRIMSLRDLFRAGVLKHVVLQKKLQASYAGSARNVRKELQELGFHRELIKANIKGIKKLVLKLDSGIASSVWADYATNNSYEVAELDVKKRFIGDVVREKKRKLTWDIGCNTGTFSKIASENSEFVLAFDADHLAIERLYQELKDTKQSKILPLIMNLANPSPNHGWRGMERKGLGERGKPDLILTLALIHHAVISANIPLSEFISWLASFNSELVIEFVTKEDPMVKKLLANKEDIYTDYELGYFENCLARSYEIVKKEELASKTRLLYYCRPR